MSNFFALILAAVTVLFGYLAYVAIQQGGLPLTQLSLPAYYITVAFIAFVNTVLFAAPNFVEE